MRKRPLLLLALAPCLCAARLCPAQAAISSDSPADPAAPPAMREMAIPSHGQSLLGVFYLAAGAMPHPTAVLLHGFPGYEQNIDLAQALRLAGWNVLAMHYRGAWGTPGVFSFQHSIEDSDTELAFVLDPANALKYRIDTARVVLIGHSMGGYMAASAAAHRAALPGPQPAGIIMISAWNIAGRFELASPSSFPAAEKAFLADTDPPDFLPLAGCTPHSLALKIFAHRTSYTLTALTPALIHSNILLLTADDDSDADSTALLNALHTRGNAHVTRQHFATDHSFSGQRIALETSILDWLAPLTHP